LRDGALRWRFAGWSGQRPSHDRECGADQMIKNAGRDGNEAIARHPLTTATLGGGNCHKRSAQSVL
jgi:hypothetical protein